MEMTQSQDSLAVCAGDMVNISCKSTQGLSSNHKENFAWHQQSHKRLPDCSSPGHPVANGSPSSFRGSESGTDFSVPISRLQSEDVAESSCGQLHSDPPTELQPQTQTSHQVEGQQVFVPLLLLLTGP
ncbi:Ig kappa chain V-IV region [Sciurus carolinensis]|uniref:Ig kappa chain V-IV region n=1 Tax=Sciurus carolinensis TaxID=30640 RepID=A0AA41NHL8_SCICA|nr:Ig kappa chain V-IV region [Sciurus carolinensis]